MLWNGSQRADRFVFDDNDDRFDFALGGGGGDYISDGAYEGNYWSNDIFHGEDGNDTLVSTGGHDVLRGGCGKDSFIITAAWYDPANQQFAPPGTQSEMLGFDLSVFGGRGNDKLTLENSDNYSLEYVDGFTIIHTEYGGTITVRGVEELEFL